MHINVLVVFVYPGVEIFLPPLIRSINGQTCREFSVLFVNDGLRDLENQLQNLEVPKQVIEVSGTPCKNRLLGMQKVREMEVENIIFQDADDLMAPNRIEECLNYLKSDYFIVNDLDLIGPSGEVLKRKYWSLRLHHNFTFHHDFITRYNLSGFTNTCVKQQLLKYLPEFDGEEVIAADWCIFYLILRQSGSRARFINSTTSLYRQHSGNITGLGELTGARLRQAIEVKRKHYEFLSEAGYDFHEELEWIAKLEKITKHEIKFKQNLNPHLFWWEETEYIHE